MRKDHAEIRCLQTLLCATAVDDLIGLLDMLKG